MQMRAATEAIYQHFVTQWASATPIVFGNEAASEPAAPFVRVSMRENTSEQLTIGTTGNRIFERHASVYVQIFAPADAGEGPLLTLMQAARNVFEGVSVSSGAERVCFLPAPTAERGNDEQHLISAIVEAPCRYQERK